MEAHNTTGGYAVAVTGDPVRALLRAIDESFRREAVERARRATLLARLKFFEVIEGEEAP